MVLSFEPKFIDTVLLCGGEGTRLQSVVSDRPKPMAEINGRPFLDIIIDNAARFGFGRLILCTGHMKDKIKQYYDTKDNSVEIVFSEEDKPLGTGGALRNARWLIKSSPFLVMNGDSMCKVNFRKFYDFHIGEKAMLSMVLAYSEQAQDYGFITLNSSNRITSFREKVTRIKNGFINAGIYFMQKDIFSYIPTKDKFSLEYDLFPKVINQRCYGFLAEGKLFDIGTPERYHKAIDILKRGILPDN